MAKNVDLKRKETESSINLLRRFSRAMKMAGVLRKVRDIRYFSRNESDFKQKKAALTRLEKRKEYEKKDKLGLLMKK